MFWSGWKPNVCIFVMIVRVIFKVNDKKMIFPVLLIHLIQFSYKNLWTMVYCTRQIIAEVAIFWCHYEKIIHISSYFLILFQTSPISTINKNSYFEVDTSFQSDFVGNSYPSRISGMVAILQTQYEIANWLRYLLITYRFILSIIRITISTNMCLIEPLKYG